MVDAGAIVVETDTFQASRLKLDEWGLGEHTLEINTKAAEIARKAVGEDRFVAGSIGPTGFLPASDDPTLGKIRFRELVDVFAEQATGPDRGRRRPAHHRDRAGHPRGQGRDLRRPRGVQEDRQDAADPVLRVAAPERRQDAARHRHPGGAHHAARARRRRHRAQLLDRPRGHARRDPLPRRELAAADPLHPERRHPAPGPRGRDDLPRGARAARGRAAGVRRALRRRRSSAAAAARRPSTSPRSWSASAAARRSARPRAGLAAARVDDDRHAARAGAARRRWSASASTRRARAKAKELLLADDYDGLRRRSPRTRSRAARTCSTSASR